MTEIRKNEFIDMLQMNELLFVEHDHFIVSTIPGIGNATYYPKSDKLQIHKTNKWELSGFNFLKTQLKKITENLYTENQLIKYSNYVLENSKLEFPKPTLLPKDFFKNN